MKRLIQATVEKPPGDDGSVWQHVTTLRSLQVALWKLREVGVPKTAAVRVQLPIMGMDRAVVAEWEDEE